MGNYCVVNTGVLIGRKDTDNQKPVIGNNVEINTGVVIFGNCTIGDNAKIAPNTVVFKDVKPNEIVSGVPAQTINKLK
jgi:serine O-acetyltransferase